MNLYNIKHPEEQVNFAQAVRQGLGKDQGLFFPENIPHLSNIDELLALPLVERSQKILGALIGEEIPQAQLAQMVRNAFTFPAPVAKVEDNIYALELFHGPTLAFKDFGGRFMAQALATVRGDGKITILTATSGDTGAAVAHAFYGLENIDVVILYPKGKISPLQEKLFCTLGGNIRTIAIHADFDACQALVKQAFDDAELRQAIGLNSANSINISRLLAQVCYYFEAAAQLPKERNGWALNALHAAAISDAQTEDTLRAMNKLGYLCEPHGAVAYEVLKQDLQAGETGLFLCTAHPAKFKESVERILDLTLPLPEALDKHNKLPLLSDEMENDFAQLRAYLLK